MEQGAAPRPQDPHPADAPSPATDPVRSADRSPHARAALRWWTSRAGRRLRSLGGPIMLASALIAALAAYPPAREALGVALERAYHAAAARPELQIQKVVVLGAQRVQAEDVEAVLGLTTANNGAFSFDAAAARARVESLGWVEKARVSLSPPQTLVVELRERVPAALWRINGDLKLLDPAGVEIAEPLSRRRWPSLPLFVGPGGRAALDEGFALYRAARAARLPIGAATRIGARRWDLELVGGPRILLPEADPMTALTWIARWGRDGRLSLAEYETLDFRVSDAPTARRRPDAELRTAEIRRR